MNSLHTLLLMVATLPLCFAGLAVADDAGELEDALDEPVSLAIQQDSLEGCLKLLAKKTRAKHSDFAIKIIGADLEKDGITRNQSIRGLEVKDQPVSEVLTALVLRAGFNPGKDPTSAEQRLVWIVGEDPDDVDHVIVLITTRAGVKQRGDKLPKVFHPKDK